MNEAFGATLVQCNVIDSSNPWYNKWQKLVSKRTSYYYIPNGAVGRDFTQLLTQEVTLLNQGSCKSERMIVFIGVVLQRDNMVKKGSDICRLIKRRMDMWKNERFDELFYEFERCSKQHRTSSTSSHTDEHTLKVFSHLMQKDQVRSAVQWLTGRKDK